jgi:hypothetical protein
MPVHSLRLTLLASEHQVRSTSFCCSMHARAQAHGFSHKLPAAAGTAGCCCPTSRCEYCPEKGLPTTAAVSTGCCCPKHGSCEMPSCECCEPALPTSACPCASQSQYSKTSWMPRDRWPLRTSQARRFQYICVNPDHPERPVVQRKQHLVYTSCRLGARQLTTCK